MTSRDEHIGALRGRWQIRDDATTPDRPYRLYRGDQDYGPHASIDAAQDAAIAIEAYEGGQP